MTRQRLKRILGILAVVGVILGALGLIRVTTAPSGEEFVAEFDSVLGLVEFADVTLAGAQVGEVTSIETTEDGKGAELTVALEDDAAEALTADASLQVRLKSLLGELYVELETGTGDTPLDGRRIENTSTDLTLDELLASLGGTLGQVSDSHIIGEMVTQISTEFEGQGDALESIAFNATELIKAISFRADSIARIINNIDVLTESLDGRAAALGESISSGARALEDLRGTLSENVETMNNTVRQLKTTLESIETSPVNKALEEIPIWLDKIDNVITTLSDLVQGRKPIHALFVSLPDLSEGFEYQLRQLAKNPMVRETLIRMLERACPTPETPGCAP